MKFKSKFGSLRSEMSSSTGYQSMMAAMPEDIEKGGQTRKDYQEFQDEIFLSIFEMQF